MAKDNSLDEVCKELDELSMRMLDLMKQYIDLKMTMEDLVKTGSLHLAKSRYIMGNKSVSVLQLPTEESELSAQTKVVGSDGDVSDLKLELSKMSLTEESSRNARDDDPQEDGLKRRKGKKKDDLDEKDNKPTSDMNDEQNKSPKKKDVMQDPLKWFGVLVPQNMRLAQTSFNKAIETSIDLANVQLEMNSIRQKFTSLLVKKKELKAESIVDNDP
uniref:Vacuolar ATPase assembly protein VMA22 n=2 Tax=Lygus hesperus TaxID=30085 RepID=A0A146M9T4_LYGHE